MEHVTILEKDGIYSLLKLHENYVANFKPWAQPNMLVVEFKDKATAADEYNKSVKASDDVMWKIVWQGKPCYG